MSVVVTGAAGFVGSAVVAELLRRGRRVVAMDRRTLAAPAAEHAEAMLALTGDLLDRDALADAALATADAVIHLAGCPGVRDSSADVAARRARDNVAATARVLAAVPAEVPLVVASSSSVYGGSAGRPSRETDALAPRGGYARSKVAVEGLCAQRAAAGGRVAVVRPFTVVGEGQRPDMALVRWLAAAEAGRPLEVFGSLERTRDLTDVRGLATVLAALAEGAQVPGGVLNVGTGRPRTLAEVVAAVAEVTGRDVRTVVTPAAAVEPADTWADTALLGATLGVVPSTDLLDVVARAHAGLMAGQQVAA